jgi:hypothetical protein
VELQPDLTMLVQRSHQPLENGMATPPAEVLALLVTHVPSQARCAAFLDLGVVVGAHGVLELDKNEL